MIGALLPPSGVIGALLPQWVSVHDTSGNADDGELLPPERAYIARAGPRRRAECVTVRACARAAMAHLGQAPAPILRGERGAPIWPHGVVGSMTHCDGYRAAAVARADDALALGIDAEPHAPLPTGVLSVVATPGELAHLGNLDAHVDGLCWDRLLFTAKVSVYKAWYPRTLRWLDFQDVQVTFDPDARTFAARLTTWGFAFAGRYDVVGDLALSAVVVASATRCPPAQ